MNYFEKLFEGALWNSRFVILAAVVGSLLAGFAIFYMATVDVVNLFQHSLHYADSSLTEEARKALHDSIVSHIVEVVDGYLLASVMLIFSLGLYELFISDLDQAHGSKASSKILVINHLDDLKGRLAKVILMIMIVTLFEEALHMKLETPLDLVYLGANLVAYTLYVTPWGLAALSGELLACVRRGWRQVDAFAALLVATGVCVLGMWLSGLFNREVERIWGFTYPLAAVLIARHALGGAGASRWRPWLYLALSCVGSAAIKQLLNTAW